MFRDSSEVEQLTVNQLVVGSIPTRGANNIGRLAQLVERFVYTEDVGSSSLSSPTIYCGCSSVG